MRDLHDTGPDRLTRREMVAMWIVGLCAIGVLAAICALAALIA